MNGEPIIVLHPDVPALGTTDFDTWLKNWHAKHNAQAVTDEDSTFKLTEEGRKVLAELQVQYGSA